MNVLVYGEKVEIPAGWIVVCGDHTRIGDRIVERSHASRLLEWRHISTGGISTLQFTCVIRRDPDSTVDTPSTQAEG